MLKELNVGDKTFFYECTVKGDAIEYLLYDSNENWTAVKTEEEVSKTLQHLNKRIKYDVSIAYDTLQNMMPEAASWTEIGESTNQLNDRVLKLKYRVKNCPFNFEWRLKRQHSSLTIPLPANAVTCLVENLPKQIAELLEVLRRKEEEIKQYRMEYGSLRRSTLTTSAFDMDKFRENYASTDMKVKILQKIVGRWHAEHGETDRKQEAEAPVRSICSPRSTIKTEALETSSPSLHKKLLESPRNKKRKTMQEKKAQMTRNLQSRRQKIEYESESQSLSESEKQQEIKDTIEAPTNAVSNRKSADNLKYYDNKNVKSVEKEESTTAKASTSKASVKELNEIIKKTSEPAKEVESKGKKLSPCGAERPNTRQRRRECTVHESNSSELMIIDVPNENVVYAVDEKVVEPAKINDNSVIISDINDMLVDKVPQSKNDLSAYVDSMLSQMDAFDKELKAQFNSTSLHLNS